MDLAINPDFGQVEADPSEVNLSALRHSSQKNVHFLLRAATLQTSVWESVTEKSATITYSIRDV